MTIGTLDKGANNVSKPKKYISKAMQLQSARILRLQAAQVALRAVARAIEHDWGDGSIRALPQDAQNGLNALSGVLFERLNEAWNQVAYFAGIHPDADKMLNSRTRRWFENQHACIMDFLGMGGGYYETDRAAFRAEVLSFFNMNPKAKKAKKRAK